MVSQQEWSQLLSGPVHGRVLQPSSAHPFLLLPGAERAGIPGLQSPSCELPLVNSGNIHLLHASQMNTLILQQTEFLQLANHPLPGHIHTLKNIPPRPRGLTKSVLPLKFYQKYPFHCFHHCKSHTYLYSNQRKDK